MPMPSPSNHSVFLADGTSANYHLRSLRATSHSIASVIAGVNNDNQEQQQQQAATDDIANWTKFCASAFSYKPDPPPPSYFARHFYNDPRRDASLVRVLVQCHHQHRDNEDNDEHETDCGEIASSVRIFRRTLSIPGHNHMEVGGIGEVCTSIEHRRRGLSSILLKDAIQIMKSLSYSSSSSSSSFSSSVEEEQRMSCSLLHAFPDFRPVYSKVGGYVSVKSEWSVIPVRLKTLLTETETTIIPSPTRGGGDGTYIIRHAKFPNDARQLKQLHKEYSEQRLITIVRSEEYWKKYVSAELGDALWVLSMKQSKSTENAQPNDTATAADTSENDTIVAWLSLRTREDRFQLREFGVDKKYTNNNTTTALAMKFLLRVALDQLGVFTSTYKGDVVSLVLPSFILSEVKHEIDTAVAFLDIDNAVEENDYGWMYIHMDNSQPSVVEITTRETDPIQHLIWPTDSF